jgi:uncharacterized protein (TIGR03118 family)
MGLLLCQAAFGQSGTYTVTKLVTNTNTGVSTDPNLLNPWGLSRNSSASPKENEWWAADHNTGLSTLYDANGTIVALKVVIPAASPSSVGSPTGTAYYNKSFVFATLDGTISSWFAGDIQNTGPACAKCHVQTATVKVNNSASGASYQGITVAKNATSKAATYYVANANGGVEAYDATSFSPVTLPAGAFTDKTVPSTYTPAGIQAIGSRIWVAYNAAAGGGTGYVDAFNTNGKLLLRLQTGWFNQPWAVMLAPANFGTFSNMILVGNNGDGMIVAFNPTTGSFQGYLTGSNGGRISLPGLWGLAFGDGNVESGPTNVLYYNAGGSNQTSGVFGAIAAN